ncbi:MAG: hypothetical protein QM750_31845 [Rubrivivax sp.]
MGNQEVLTRLVRLYEEVFAHDGFGEIRIEVRLLKRGQKEVILHCGKQYRFVVDYSDRQPMRWGVWKVVDSRVAQDRREGRDRRREVSAIDFPERRRGNDRRRSSA